MMNPSATPTVNDDELLQTITLAASQIPEQLKASTDRLKALLDTHAGTYNALHRVAADLSQPPQVRQQSIIQFKNAALSHWRSRKSVLRCHPATRPFDHSFRLLSEDDRTQIRHRSFAFLSEADDTVRSSSITFVSRSSSNNRLPNVMS